MGTEAVAAMAVDIRPPVAADGSAGSLEEKEQAIRNAIERVESASWPLEDLLVPLLSLQTDAGHKEREKAAALLSEIGQHHSALAASICASLTEQITRSDAHRSSSRSGDGGGDADGNGNFQEDSKQNGDISSSSSSSRGIALEATEEEDKSSSNNSSSQSAAVGRRCIMAASCLFRSIFYSALNQASPVETVVAKWEAAMKLHDAIRDFAVQQANSGMRMHAVKFLEASIFLFLPSESAASLPPPLADVDEGEEGDADGSASSAAAATSASTLDSSFAIPDGHPILDAANLSEAAMSSLACLLSLLKPPAVSSVSEPVIITLLASLSIIAIKRPLLIGRILPPLISLAEQQPPSSPAVQSEPSLLLPASDSCQHALRAALVRLLRCGHANAIPWRERLVRSLRGMGSTAAAAADSALRHLERAARNAERERGRGVREEEKAPGQAGAAANGVMSNIEQQQQSSKHKRKRQEDGIRRQENGSRRQDDGAGRPEVKQEPFDTTDQDPKRQRVAFASTSSHLTSTAATSFVQSSASLQQQQQQQSSEHLVDASRVFGDESGLSPLQRMLGMLSALVDKGEKARASVDLLVNSLPPDMLADIVIAYMEHLPAQAPSEKPPGGAAGAAEAKEVAAKTEVKRDPRRDPRRADPRKARVKVEEAAVPAQPSRGADVALATVKVEGVEMRGGVGGEVKREDGTWLADERRVAAGLVEGVVKQETAAAASAAAAVGAAEAAAEAEAEELVEPVEFESLSDEERASLIVEALTRLISSDAAAAAVGAAELRVDLLSRMVNEAGDPSSVLDLLRRHILLSEDRAAGMQMASSLLFALWANEDSAAADGLPGEAAAQGSRQLSEATAATLATKMDVDEQPHAMAAPPPTSRYRDFLLSLIRGTISPPAVAAAASASSPPPATSQSVKLLLPLLLDCPSLPSDALLLFANCCQLSLPGGLPASAAATAAAEQAGGGEARGGEEAGHADALGGKKGGAAAAAGEVQVDLDVVHQGLVVLWKLIAMRPAVRSEALDIVLECTVHHRPGIRSKAVALVSNRLFLLPFLAAQIESFAVDNLNRVVDLTPPPPPPPPQLPQTTDGVPPSAPAGVEDASGEVQRWLALFCALCVQKSALLPSLFSAFGQAPLPAKKAILRDSLPPLLSSLALFPPPLIPLIESPPPGAIKLVLKAIHCQLDDPRLGSAPPAAFLSAVKKLSAARPAEPELLLPVLPFFSKDEVLSLLPRVLQLPIEKFKLAQDRILQGTAHSAAPLSPSELLVSLHSVQPKRDNVPLKKLAAICSACTQQQSLFSQQVMAKVLNLLVEQTPLPFLFFRTMLEAVALHKDLVGFVAELLSRLVAKQVWKEHPQLWLGFIKCCTQTTPNSFATMLKLPAAQLDDALKQAPELKATLAEFASRPNIRPTVQRSLLTVLGLVPEAEA